MHLGMEEETRDETTLILIRRQFRHAGTKKLTAGRQAAGELTLPVCSASFSPLRFERIRRE
jgi:hypothetical protein